MPAQENTEREAPARGGRIVFFVLLLIGAAALGAWFWSTRRIEPGLAGGGSAAASTLHLETFVLNLADPGQRSYLRVGIDLGLGRELGRSENVPVALVRDTILGVLGQARVADLLEEKGKAKLKADLLRALQERVPGLAVEEVYFTEFLIQR
ncbi:MAG: flagellar basal body-associated FliL family protein [Candidatus Sulfotelmatobacter sp.]